VIDSLLLATFPSLKMNELGRLSNREYYGLFIQAYNITGFRISGHLEKMTPQNIKKKIKKDFESRGGEEWLNS
jgi:hypothetical protein